MEAPITGAVSRRSVPRRFIASRFSGNLFECVAARWLRRHGHRIVARQVRVRGVEIDLVTALGAAAVFVEVRGRTRGDRRPGEWLSAKKLQRLRRAAEESRYGGRAVRKLLFVEVVGPAPRWLCRWPWLVNVLPLGPWRIRAVDL